MSGGKAAERREGSWAAACLDLHEWCVGIRLNWTPCCEGSLFTFLIHSGVFRPNESKTNVAYGGFGHDFYHFTFSIIWEPQCEINLAILIFITPNSYSPSKQPLIIAIALAYGQTWLQTDRSTTRYKHGCRQTGAPPDTNMTADRQEYYQIQTWPRLYLSYSLEMQSCWDRKTTASTSIHENVKTEHKTHSLLIMLSVYSCLVLTLDAFKLTFLSNTL